MDKSYDFQNSGEESSEERPSRFQEKGIPNLGVSSNRKLNVKVMIFIVTVALSIMALFYYMLVGAMRKNNNTHPKDSQGISIPKQPTLTHSLPAEPKPLTEGATEAISDPIPLRSARLTDALKPQSVQPLEPSYSVTSYGVNMYGGYKAPGTGGLGDDLAKRRGMASGGVVTALGGKIISENSASTPVGSSGGSFGFGNLGPVGDSLRSISLGAQGNNYPAPDGLGVGIPAAGGASVLDSLGLTSAALSGSPTPGLNATGAGGARNAIQQVSVDTPTIKNTFHRALTADIPPGLMDPASSESAMGSLGGGQGRDSSVQYFRGDDAGESIKSDSTNVARRSGGGSVAFPVNYARAIPHEPSTYIPQGTAVRCILQTLIMTDIPGPTSCNVVEDVRSFDARRVLIPKGSRVMGEYKPVSDSIDRVAIIWTRVITPQNIDISIQSPGISPLGTLGVKGEVDNRWGDRLSGALMISLASDALKYAVQTRSPTIDNVSYNSLGVPIVTKQPFESATIRNIEKFVEQDLTRSMRLTPRVVILQGTVVSIFTAQDLNFSQVMDAP